MALRTHYRVVGFLFLACMLMAPSAPAAQVPVTDSLITGTDWVLNAKAKASATGVGTLSSAGNLNLTFGSGHTFQLLDDDDYGFDGTWSINPKGQLQMAVTESTIEDFILTYAQPILDQYDASLNSVDVTSVNSKVQLAIKEGLGTMTYAFSFKAEIVATDPMNKIKKFHMNYSVTGKGQHPLGATSQQIGSRWALQGTAALNALGHNFKYQGNYLLYLGPLDAPYNLSPNTFALYEIVNGTQQELRAQGSYFKLKNKITLLADQDPLEDSLLEFCQEVAQDNNVEVNGLSIVSSKYSVSTSKNETAMQFSVQFVCAANVYFPEDNEYDLVKCTVSIKTTGTRQ